MDFDLRNLIFCSCFLLCFTGILSAQDKIASEIISQSRETFLNVDDFSADLTYSLYVHPIQREPDSGKIMYKDKHFFISLGEQKIFCDGSTQWEYTPKYSEVRIFDHNPYQGIGLIFKIFLEGGNIKYLGEGTLNERAYDLVALENLPEDKYDYARVWIDKENQLPIRIVLSSPSLTEVSLMFSNLGVNQDLPDDLFHFDLDEFPNVQIIDERETR